MGVNTIARARAMGVPNSDPPIPGNSVIRELELALTPSRLKAQKQGSWYPSIHQLLVRYIMLTEIRMDANIDIDS